MELESRFQLGHKDEEEFWCDTMCNGVVGGWKGNTKFIHNQSKTFTGAFDSLKAVASILYYACLSVKMHNNNNNIRLIL